ncbi:MAG TPA: penicillin-binding protein 2 [Gaiellaceae bacterium]|nr:penicillin-binding protein 2 [Gaiellaceae bacterium]
MASVTRIPPRTRFMPRDPRVEEPYRMTPAMALRLGILGALVLFVFAVLFFRLWALQVLSGDQYLAAAQDNQLRTVRVQAARGPILDDKGRVLVSNRIGTAAQVWTAYMPRRGRNRMLRRLSAILLVPVPELQRRLREHEGDPLTPVTLKEDLSQEEIFYLKEHRRDFPGLELNDVHLRDYRYGALAAQVLGHVGEVTEAQLKGRRYHSGDVVGQAGLEFSYDRYLRGTAGLAELRVDSLGRPRSKPLRSEQPQPGLAIRTTLDAKLQRAAQDALEYGIRVARENDSWAANAGAAVAIDPRTGAIRALASSPTFDPRVYVGKPHPRELRPLLDAKAAERANFPGLDRATSGLYPPGSTWKPVTALAAMREHLVGPYSPLSCVGQMTIDGTRFRNWNPYANEAMDLPTALAASCDTYFYQLGLDFYNLPPEYGSPLQKWASAFGFGKATGLDVGGEATGLLPTPEWRRKTFTRERYPDTWEVDRLWKSGDSVQLAIGQKDLLVTPLQMARFYALVANGGKLVTPHLVSSVEQPGNSGAVKAVFSPAPKDVNVDPAELNVIKDGLFRATHASYGTSAGVFGSFPVPIAGKTGTAEKSVRFGSDNLMMDQSWWCGFGPTDKTPQLVVCVVIENGGHGSTAAAPAALKIFERYFDREAPVVETGVKTD